MIEQLLQFGSNHWILCSLFAIAVILIIFEEIRGKLTGLPKISARDATLLLNRENAVVLDLRNQKPFFAGHILGAINIDRIDIDSHLKQLEPYKDKTLILVDDYESNAFPIGNKLRTQGFTKIHVLAGGLSSWRDEQLPLSKNN